MTGMRRGSIKPPTRARGKERRRKVKIGERLKRGPFDLVCNARNGNYRNAKKNEHDALKYHGILFLC
jgi:hypothetical protein